MDREKAIKALRELQGDGDTEVQHHRADGVLVQLLVALGYNDVVTEWELVDKWYA